MTKQDLFLECKDNLKEMCGDGIPLMLAELTSVSWLWYSLIGLQDVTTSRKQVKATWGLSVLFP